jgi:hypothetical protein
MGADAMLGPDGRPSTFDGAAWISADRKYWWNGAAWQPVKRQGFHPPIALAVTILLVLAGAWYFFERVVPNAPGQAVVLGVSHAKIDSTTRIEFDYASSTPCNDLTFQLVFYDQAGHSLGTYLSDPRFNVAAGVTHHWVFYTTDAIPPKAVRFQAIPTCHS